MADKREPTGPPDDMGGGPGASNPVFVRGVPYTKTGTDIVNHPSHYTQGRIEVIDFIEDQGLGFHLGNVVKYVCRYRLKGGKDDLEKARWYLDRLISSM